MKRTIVILLFLLVGTSKLWAQEVGQINAELNGEARLWHVISITRGDKTALSASMSNLKRLPTLSLQGHLEPKPSTTDALYITAHWMGAFDAAKSPTGVEIIFMPNGMSKPFYTSDQLSEKPALTIDTAVLDESSGHVSGSFSGKICLVPKLYETPDPNDCKTVSGSFDTDIQVR